MKKKYFILLLITTVIVSITNAQEVPADIKFFTTEGYTNNSELNDNANWQTNHVNHQKGLVVNYFVPRHSGIKDSQRIMQDLIGKRLFRLQRTKL